jgi:hypothetical protein
MRTVEPSVRLWVDEGVLGGQCLRCGVYLEQVDDHVEPDEAGVGTASHAFLAVHPDQAGLPHLDRVPTGWVRPLSGPGALSQ